MVMILLGLQVALKKPLCINSKSVYKIDKILGQESETIFSCDQSKMTRFSQFFYENLDSLQSRLVNLEVLLVPFEISQKSVIVLDDNEQDKDKVREILNGLVVGAELFETKKFEKAFIQYNLRNKFQINDPVFFETISDYLVDDGEHQNLISKIWSESFSDLSFLEKRKLIRQLAIVMSTYQNFSDLNSIEKLKVVSPGEMFNQNLVKSGFLKMDEMTQYNIDIILDIGTRNDLLKKFIELATEYPNMKFAVQNSEGIRLLPSNLKLPKDFGSRLVTQYRLIFEAEQKNKAQIDSNLQTTERLVFIQTPTQLESLNYKPLFVAGVSSFLASNKDINFIQLHLPSYQLKKTELKHISDYFSFIKNQNSMIAERKILGWTQTEWVKDFRAFKPVANYDVIQYFRVN